MADLRKSKYYRDLDELEKEFRGALKENKGGHAHRELERIFREAEGKWNDITKKMEKKVSLNKSE